MNEKNAKLKAEFERQRAECIRGARLCKDAGLNVAADELAKASLRLLVLIDDAEKDRAAY